MTRFLAHELRMPESDAVMLFESEFAKYVGAKYAVAVSSGTTGLMVAMMALNLRPRTRVVTTPLTHVSTSNAILSAGGIPIFADIDRNTLCLDPFKAIRAAKDRLVCILGVHLYGCPFDFKAYDGIRERGVRVVEDAAQALGASRGGRMVGTHGDLAVFSFYDTKHIRLGEGGMVTTQDAELAERCRLIRSHGQSKPYYHTALGYNFRLPQSIAEAGRRELPKIEKEVERRRRIAKVYSEQLEGVEGIRLQGGGPEVRHSYYMFPVVVERLAPERIDALARAVSLKTSCRVGRGYGLLTYQQPLYRRINSLFWGAKLMRFPDYSRYRLPCAEHAVARLLELPTGRMDGEQAVRLSRSLVHELRR